MGLKDTPDLCLLAGENLEKNRLVRLDASGDWVYCDAGEYPLAVTTRYTADGAPATGLLFNKEGTLRVTAAGSITIYEDAFTAADGKISATNSGVRVGKVLQTAAASGIVDVVADLDRVPMVNTAASAAIGASSTAEADFDKTCSIPAQDLKAGSIIRVHACGIVVGQDTTPQFDVKLYAGTEVVATVTVAAAATNDQFTITAEIVVRTIGASGTIIAQVSHVCDAAGTAIQVRNMAVATESTASGLTIKCSGQFNASHASNTARLDILEVEHLR